MPSGRPPRSSGNGGRGSLASTDLPARARPPVAPVPSHPGAFPDIYDYGAIGNLSTAALISRNGSIDWLCLPEFSSPSVFGRILDRTSGGYHQVAVDGLREATQRYIPGTNVLRTHLGIGAGRGVTVTDLMPLPENGRSAPRLLRLLHADGGGVDLTIEVDARFDYGRKGPARWIREDDGSVVATAGRARLRCVAPWPWEIHGPLAVSRGHLAAEREVATEVIGGTGAPCRDPAALRDATVDYWRDWVRHPDSPMHRAAHIWRDWVERSELLLKLLSHRGTGAFVAAPTTSLPEWPGGPRNWDYRFFWVRDAAFAVQAFLLLGHVEEARAYLKWIVGRLGSVRRPGDLRVIYSVDDGRALEEETLDHWEGYEGSTPVRIGNAAVDQLQLDIYGEVLDAIAQLAPIDPELVRSAWPRLAGLADHAASQWERPDAGIWESRAEPRHYVYSKVMCWVALDRAASLAWRFGERKASERWRAVADRIQKTVLERGFDEKLGAFVQAFDRPVLDAAVLRLPLTGFLPFDDPRIRGTIRAIERSLARGPFVYRYDSKNSMHGPEGSFQICSFWLVECLARSGEVGRAVRNFRELLRAAGPLRLFSEEYDPVAHRALGNYPQAFTHIGVLRAALAIGIRG